jgi:hypothetical protein
LQDTSELPDDDARALQEDRGLVELHGASTAGRAQHHWIQLRHPEISSSVIYIRPEQDILWLGQDTDMEQLDELNKYYGLQLSTIQNVLFEETEWDDLEDSIMKLDYFPGVRTIYVWLDSYRFQAGATVTNEQGYVDKAAEFQDRDRRALHGRNLMVEYIDYENNIYGGFRANVVE